MKKNILLGIILFAVMSSYSQEKSKEFKSLKEFALYCQVDKFYTNFNDVELILLYYNTYYNPELDKSNNCGYFLQWINTPRGLDLKNRKLFFKVMIEKFHCSSYILTYTIDFEDMDFQSYEKEIYQNYLKDKPLDYYSLLMIGKFKVERMCDSLEYYKNSKDSLMRKGAYLGLVRASKIAFKEIPKDIHLSEKDSIFGRSQEYLDQWQMRLINDKTTYINNGDYVDEPYRNKEVLKLNTVFYEIPGDYIGVGGFLKGFLDKIKKYKLQFKLNN